MDPAILAEYDAMRNVAARPFRSVCYAPFLSLVFDSIGRVRVCCANFEYPLGDIRTERLDDIWNGPRIEKLRHALRNYELHHGCGLCGLKIANGAFRSGLEDSALATLKFEPFEVEAGPPFKPKHMEFHLSNKCNLECVTCFGEFSSKIREHRDKLPPYPPAYTDQFFADLEKYLPDLKYTQFLGGEPFLIPEMYRVWDMLIERKLTPVVLITSNGTVWSSKVERILNSLPVSMGLSCDGATKETYEKIRVGARFDVFLKNFRRFRDNCLARKKGICLNFTISRLNWHEFPDILLFAENEGVVVTVLDVFDPRSLSLYTLPPNELEQVVAALERRAEDVRLRLRYLGNLLDTKLSELRYRLSHHDERLFIEPLKSPTEPAPSSSLEPPPSSRSYLVDVFRNAGRWMSEDQARRALREWNPGGAIDRIVLDETDTVVSVASDLGGVFDSIPVETGIASEALLGLLASRFGEKVEMVESDDEPSRYSRLVRFTREGGESTLARAVFAPILAPDGVPKGTVTLLSHKSEPRLVVLSS